MKHLRKFLVLVMVLSLTLQSGLSNAHSGRTDSSGGHNDNRNASGLGGYHYHHGMGPHLHSNGACPYSSSGSSSKSSKSNGLSASQKKVRTSNKKYQKMLNKLKYQCGNADGILGAKSKRAIKKFQKKNKLTVTGKLNKSTKKKISRLYHKKY